MTQNSDEKTQGTAAWPSQLDLPTLPANNFAVGKVGDFTYLTFGELDPFTTGSFSPPGSGTPEVRIKPVASIVLGQDGHKVLTRLLVQALETEGLEELARFVQDALHQRQED